MVSKLKLTQLTLTLQLAAMRIRRFPRLDILINNACQTIRRPAQYYRHLLPDELCDRDSESVFQVPTGNCSGQPGTTAALHGGFDEATAKAMRACILPQIPTTLSQSTPGLSLQVPVQRQAISDSESLAVTVTVPLAPLPVAAMTAAAPSSSTVTLGPISPSPTRSHAGPGLQVAGLGDAGSESEHCYYLSQSGPLAGVRPVSSALLSQAVVLPDDAVQDDAHFPPGMFRIYSI